MIRRDIQMKVARRLTLSRNNMKHKKGIKWKEPNTHNITKVTT